MKITEIKELKGKTIKRLTVARDTNPEDITVQITYGKNLYWYVTVRAAELSIQAHSCILTGPNLERSREGKH